MKLNSLTSLRIFAALAVFMNHASTISFFSGGKLNYVGDFFYVGNIGVGFFYILSGFIISYSYKDRLKSGITGKTEFILLRLARVYPLHILTFIAAIVIYNGSQILESATVERAIFNVLLLQSWLPDVKSAFSFNGVSWSISVEVFFYISFTMIAFLRFRTVLVTSLVILSVIVYLQRSDFLSPDVDRVWMFYINPVFRLFDFMVGVMIYHAYTKLSVFKISKNTSSALEMLSILILALALYFKHQVSSEMRLDLYYVIPMAIIVMTFSLTDGVISRAISARPLVFMGEASFSFYMVHQIVFNYYLMNVQFSINSVSDIAISSCIVLVASLALSVLTYSLYEKPMNNLIRKKIMKGKVKPNLASVS